MDYKRIAESGTNEEMLEAIKSLYTAVEIADNDGYNRNRRYRELAQLVDGGTKAHYLRREFADAVHFFWLHLVSKMTAAGLIEASDSADVRMAKAIEYSGLATPTYRGQIFAGYAWK
jgi:hypothetical protein